MPGLVAFGFANPSILWGLALGSLPVLIHLLYRRAYRDTDWAAMRFLQEAARKNARRLRLEQIILLAVRMLVLILAALAFAEPLVEAVAPRARARNPLHRVVVVDASFSMRTAAPDGQTRFDRAQKAARQIVTDSLAGDAVHLLRIVRHSSPAIVREPAFARDPVLAEIDRLAPSDEPGDLRPTLTDVVLALADPRAPITKEVVFLSDFQRFTWAGDGTDRAGLRELFQQIADRARIVLVDVGDGNAENAAVTSLETVDPVSLTNQPTRLRAGVRNFGGANLVSQRVELYVDGYLAAFKSIDLPGREEAVLEFHPEFHGAGEHGVEVRIPPDRLAADNQRWLSVPAVERVRVLLVNGRAGGRPAENASYYLSTVLAPSTSREPWAGVTQSKVIHESDLGGEDLSLYDALFLCNVALLTPSEADLLRAYAEAGGGLVIVLGDRVKLENYNALLYRDGKGPLPALLGNRVGDARDSARGGFTFDAGDLTHPVLDAFRGNPKAGLDRAVTLEYVEAKVPAGSAARVVLRFSSGDPAIVEKPVGRGRCVLVATSADVSWTAWPVHPTFPPIIHELVRYAARGRWHGRNVLVGEPIVRVLSSRDSNVDFIVQRPDGGQQTVRRAANEKRDELVYAETARRGLYEVSPASPAAKPQAAQGAGHSPAHSRGELFAVNVDPRESDLEAVNDKALRAGLLAGIPYVRGNHWAETPRDQAGEDAASTQLSLALLAAVVALLVVEPLLAWQFWPGFLLLGALVSAGLAFPLASRNVPIALVVGIACFAAFVAIMLLAGGTRGPAPLGGRLNSLWPGKRFLRWNPWRGKWPRNRTGNEAGDS